MRIGTLSDLHIDGNKRFLKDGESFEELLSSLLIEKEIDLFLIAGDVSNYYLETDVFLKKVRALSGVPVLFVPGNHDYWAKDHELSDTHEVDAFFRKQPYALAGKPYIINDEWAVVGTPGWYDYGYADHEMYSLEKFARKQYSFATWNDKHYVDWGKSDQEMSTDMLETLVADIKAAEDRQIIMMTHVATHKEFVVPLPSRVYNYANAFLGAKGYEILYELYPNIRYSIMGHVHLRKTFQDADRFYVTACLGNHRHWREKDSLSQLEQSFVYFDIVKE